MSPSLHRVGSLGALLLCSGAAVLVCLVDTPRQDASARVATDQVTEARRAVDRVGKVATRISPAEEMQLGQAIAARIEATQTTDASPDGAYVSAVLERLVSHGRLQRPAIRYAVRVLRMPVINAYAVPGGRLYVTTGLLAFVESEAELASILGHEIAHVDRRHCIERIQYRLAAEKVLGSGFAALVDLGTRLWTVGFSRLEELEADRQGTLIAHRAGYHPSAGLRLFRRLLALRGGQGRAPESIPAELRAVLGTALAEYLGSHPTETERLALHDEALAEAGVDLDTERTYLGRRNLRERTPMSRRVYDEEWVTGRDVEAPVLPAAPATKSASPLDASPLPD
jgi:predicted Zn-dependent protease